MTRQTPRIARSTENRSAAVLPERDERLGDQGGQCDDACRPDAVEDQAEGVAKGVVRALGESANPTPHHPEDDPDHQGQPNQEPQESDPGSEGDAQEPLFDQCESKLIQGISHESPSDFE